MADDQQATPSAASETVASNEENIEDQREEEKKEALQIIFSELKNDFEARVREGASFSINFDYDSDLSTSKNGRYVNIEGWKVTFDFTKSESDNANEFKINFEVKSTPIGKNSETRRVSKTDRGYVEFIAAGNSISTNFYYKKNLFKLLEINNEIEIPQKELSLEPHKQVNPEILEVWFPPKSESMSLQCPIKLSDENDDWIGAESQNWLEIDEGLVVESPTMRIENGEVDSDFDKWWSVVRSVVSYWTVAAVYSEKRIGSFLADDKGGESNTDKEKKSEDHWGLPPKHLFEPVRPVNLNPSDVLLDLEKDGLHFPWHVIESACAALNAGKNVIFTGPPGCGKSKLASFLAQKATRQRPLMVTASPAWTSGDLIGRYMPARNGKGLVFREGFLLRAVPQSGVSKWLIIDEFNRADIDSCFGELFSVLAGDAVQLPFEKLTEGDGELVEEEEKTKSTSFVRIIPATADHVEAQPGDYRVPRRFRLIGTMNDADRSGLNNLSFALMRRFAFIPVEAPSNEVISQIINGKSDEKGEIERTTDDLNLEKYSWHIAGKNSVTNSGESKIESIRKELNSLFCISRSDHEFDNLISSKSVGIAIIKDVIRFVGEGMRSPGSGKERSIDFRAIEEKKLPGKQSVEAHVSSRLNNFGLDFCKAIANVFSSMCFHRCVFIDVFSSMCFHRCVSKNKRFARCNDWLPD